jgi:type II secretory ATPase GspE/PulE/Tfp pilus assembly ATPase PilB-like protein
MPQTLRRQFEDQISGFDPEQPEYATRLVESILAGAQDAGASDIHLVPTESELLMSWRIDGVLQTVASLPRKLAANVVSRLKVLADLLTYRTDVPQEGRIRQLSDGVERRVSTFPTLYGEKAVVRLFVGSKRFHVLDDLQLPQHVTTAVRQLLLESGGIVLLTGPAGSGKTTTAYACLRELAQMSPSPRSLVSLEDPIEAVVAGVSQSQINPSAGFDYASGLRSLMRQDPEVMLVGEIRDRLVAEMVFQASLTGHLVLTTFHAGSAAGTISRLADMGNEPYLLRSCLLAIVCQHLCRRLCECSQINDDPDARLGLPVRLVRRPVGCDQCRGTGYRGRTVIAEVLLPQSPSAGRAVLSRSDAVEIERRAVQAGMRTRWQHACELIEAGETDPAEVRRVLGFGGQISEDPDLLSNTN